MQALITRFRDARYSTLVILTLIVLVGAYFRLDDYASLARFNNDQVRDIRIVEAMAQGEWPLLGPKAGGTTFQLGPAFYYLEYLSGLIFGMTPSGITLLVPLLSLTALPLFYLLLRTVLSPPVALSMTALAAGSAFLAKYARFGWNPNFLPCFLLLFLFALLRLIDPDERRVWRWYLLAGITMGIGMQLHTLTFLLMPVLFVLAHGYRAWQTKKLSLAPALGAIVIVLTLFTPVFLSEFRSGWANTQAFLTGITTKTASETIGQHPVLVTADFFLQGQAAILTGYEPRGQWINPGAWSAAWSPANTLLFLFTLGVTLMGGVAYIRTLRSSTTSVPTKRALSGLAVLLGLSLTLFLLLGEELNLRFFILISLFPFLFLGLALEWLWRHLGAADRLARTRVPLISLALTLLFVLNAYAHQSTYDFKHPRSFTKAYGGISLGEAHGLATAIKTALTERPEYAPRLSAFDHERSLQYFLDQDNIRLETLKERSERPDGRFFIRSGDASAKAFEPFAGRFDARHIETVGRFELYWLKPKSAQP